MPYIKKNERDRYSVILMALRETEILNGGHLNYLFCKLALIYLNQRGASYQTWSDIHSAFSLGDAELRRRFLDSYEDVKRSENGDLI